MSKFIAMSHTKKIIILFLFIIVSSGQFISKGYSQPALNNVGIGTTTPDASAILDLESNNLGFLVPRVTTIQRLAIITPARGLLVYDIDFKQFWFFDGTIWRTFDGGGWLTTGNAGTIAGPNFLGTTDATDFVIKTGGSSAGFERMRIWSDGHIIVNKITPNIGDLFSAYATGSNGAINPIGTTAIAGYSGANGTGIYGENTGTGSGVFGSSLNNGTGVYGTNNGAFGDGVWGDNSGQGAGVRGQSLNNGTGVFGYNKDNGYGVYGYNPSTGIAVIAVNADSLAGAGYAMYSLCRYRTSFGLYAVNTDTMGTGILGIGNNTTASYLATGSGGAFNGSHVGLYSIAEDMTGGTGILAVGNNLSTFGSIPEGAGIAANGDNIGVFGHAWTLGSASDPNRAGGYFVDGPMPGGAFAYVGMFDGTANRKIVGNGTVNTIVKNTNNESVMLSAPESPENLFQDYGTGTLSNGKTSIKLDPDFAKNIAVDNKHPLRVFIQIEGDCKGVYVTNKTQNGFDVIELESGSSNVAFTWSVTANRADETRNDGFVLKYSQERFTKAPKPLEEKNVKVNTVDKKVDINLEKYKKPIKHSTIDNK
jgi:hypothetical protein